MHTEWNSLHLDSLGVLRAAGADAATFLQGQLSNDVTRLRAERSLLAGYHNPQGRTLALLRLLLLDGGDVLAVLPRELIAALIARLTKFIFRAKVKLSDESAEWKLRGLIGPEPGSGATASLAGALPHSIDAVTRINESIAVRIGKDARWLLIAPLLETSTVTAVAPVAPETWRLLGIGAGEPQVYAATSGEFVAQMLNLDCLGAIALDKGCYTGQEVIARAHYRGRVKRRMRLFRSRGVVQLEPGDAGQLGDGRSFKVVDAARLADGRCEFLAVTAAVPADMETAGAAHESASADTHVDAQQLALPYPLPE